MSELRPVVVVAERRVVVAVVLRVAALGRARAAHRRVAGEVVDRRGVPAVVAHVVAAADAAENRESAGEPAAAPPGDPQGVRPGPGRHARAFVFPVWPLLPVCGHRTGAVCHPG